MRPFKLWSERSGCGSLQVRAVSFPRNYPWACWPRMPICCHLHNQSPPGRFCQRIFLKHGAERSRLPWRLAMPSQQKWARCSPGSPFVRPLMERSACAYLSEPLTLVPGHAIMPVPGPSGFVCHVSSQHNTLPPLFRSQRCASPP